MTLLLDIRHAMLPEALLSLVILLCCVLTFLLKDNQQKFCYYTAKAGIVSVLVSFAALNFDTGYNALCNSFVSDCYTILFRLIIVVGAIMTLGLSKKYTSGFGNSRGEFFVLILTATLGAMLLAGANDLVMVFVAIETLSISSYALCGYTKLDKFSNEAAIKYLIIGAASTAILLYGFSYLYGITGDRKSVV